MSANKIILVTPNDQRIGVIEKIKGHQFGMLHRAFSVVLFRNKNGTLETLLQQRSSKKYHGGGLWTNTCCSHPRPGEKILKAAEKRLEEEMGIQTKLKELGKFHYIAKLDHGMTENEIDHVFVGTYESDHININQDEVDAYEWVDVRQLKKDLAMHNENYTPWLEQVLEMALKYYKP